VRAAITADPVMATRVQNSHSCRRVARTLGGRAWRRSTGTGRSYALDRSGHRPALNPGRYPGCHAGL